MSSRPNNLYLVVPGTAPQTAPQIGSSSAVSLLVNGIPNSGCGSEIREGGPAIPRTARRRSLRLCFPQTISNALLISCPRALLGSHILVAISAISPGFPPVPRLLFQVSILRSRSLGVSPRPCPRVLQQYLLWGIIMHDHTCHFSNPPPPPPTVSHLR